VTDRKPIEELVESYRAAVQAKDVDAFVKLYDEHVRVFDLWGRWSYDGVDQWRGVATQWFDSLGDDQVAVEWHDLHSVVGEDVAAAYTFVVFKGVSAAGEKLRAMHNRLTWVLRKTPEGPWKILHEHTSAPVDFETSKVILQK
jgi:ketosteroid isomerase-like protein